MLMVLSPAKTLAEGPAIARLPATMPDLLGEARGLVSVVRGLSAADLGSLMSISPALAELNHGRFHTYDEPFTPQNSRQAIRMFRGDVYLGFDAETMADDDLVFAQDRVAILSGLYGALRPLDLIQPYRLEMGTRLDTPRGGTLYAYWGDRVTDWLSTRLAGQDNDTLVNLASKEYFGVVRPRKLPGTVIEPVFRDIKAGKARVISFFAKRARGEMARWAVVHRIDDPADLRAFDGGGYAWQSDLSTSTRWVFTRAQPPPPTGK